MLELITRQTKENIVLDYVHVKRSLEEKRRLGLPFKCWCPYERENVIQLRPKYEIGQLCKVCMGDLG